MENNDQPKTCVNPLTETTDGNITGVLVCIPDNGRGPTGTGRHGNVIIYDEAHPAESFMRPEERRGKPSGPCPV